MNCLGYARRRQRIEGGFLCYRWDDKDGCPRFYHAESLVGATYYKPLKPWPWPWRIIHMIFGYKGIVRRLGVDK